MFNHKPKSGTVWFAVLVASLVLGAAIAAFSIYRQIASNTNAAPQKDNHMTDIDDRIHTNALYEWRDFRKLSREAYGAELSRLSGIGFDSLFVSVNPYVDIADSGAADVEQQKTAYLNALQEFAGFCQQHGFRLELLAGDMTWAKPDTAYLGRHAIDLAARFNAGSPPQAVRQVQFDIEAYNLPDYDRRATEILSDLVTTAASLYDYARSAGWSGQRLSVGFAVPFWFDNDNDRINMISFNGSSKYPFYHLADLADVYGGFLVVMAYRNQLEGEDGVLTHVQHETEYLAAKTRARLYVAQETGDVSPAKTTYYQMEQGTLIGAINRLHEHYGDKAYYGGVIVNDLEAFAANK